MFGDWVSFLEVFGGRQKGGLRQLSAPALHTEPAPMAGEGIAGPSATI